MARRLAGLIPFYEYDEARFFCSDGAPADVATRRRNGFECLSDIYRTRFAATIRKTAEAADSLSDLQFTDAYRVPFQYRSYVSRHLPSAAFIEASDGVQVSDLDGNRLYDVSGSYGVNLFGYEFYKAAIERAAARMCDLGPVLGPYHPVVVENVDMLKDISGLGEVSFHMSGTETVMQAVRLARYHTRRSHLVRFCVRLSRLVGRCAAGNSAIRCRRTRPIRWRYVARSAAGDWLAARCRLRAGQIRCRRCIRMLPRQAIPRWSTAAGAGISTGIAMRPGSRSSAWCAPSEISS